MATGDFSRSAFDPRKHYSGVRMQQGRVIIDDDWNESQAIADDVRRRELTDIVGPSGSPDEGFRINNPEIVTGNLGEGIDFEILSGAFYLGGLRVEMETIERFRTQADWLQQSLNAPPVPSSERYDLVYMEAWEQPVEAEEASELFEPALGGVDTAFRTRLVRRVRVAPDIGTDDCATAWRKLVREWAGNHWGTVNRDGERMVDTKLKVDFAPGDEEDPCRPAARAGYLGAQNQTIRIQLVESPTFGAPCDRFTWGFNNASPLYRVLVRVDGNGKKVEMLTLPKDEAHWPQAGQVVEILPWSAVLPNNEKLAAMRGHLTKVQSAYDSLTRQLTLADAVPDDFGTNWEQRSDSAGLAPTGGAVPYYFMRAWCRGSDRESPAAITFTPGRPIALGKTGLQVAITGENRAPGDFWAVAVRPETPNRVLPWGLARDMNEPWESATDGLKPHGARRFFAPLAIIRWTPGQKRKFDGVVMRDCRRRFRSLTELQTCCTVTVGDGMHSRGDFKSIEAALDNLPAAGGDICLLSGVHEADVHIVGRRNITIRGCGRMSVVRPRRSNLNGPVFHVRHSQKIALTDLAIETAGGSGMLLEDSGDVLLRGNTIVAHRGAVRARGVAGLEVRNNQIRMWDGAYGEVAVYVLVRGCVIDGNRVLVVPAKEKTPRGPKTPEPPDKLVPTNPCADYELIYANPAVLSERIEAIYSYQPLLGTGSRRVSRAPGGIQVAGGSERVTISRNEIIGGTGNGITLGNTVDWDALLGSGADKSTYQVKHAGGRLVGQVAVENHPVEGVSLAFVREADLVTHRAVTGDNGTFAVSMEEGDYEMSVQSAGYRITAAKARTVSSRLKANISYRRYEVELAEKESTADWQSVFAFMYELRISDNLITGMGLSGIGLPLLTKPQRSPGRLAARVAPVLGILAMLGNPVIQLRICRNIIRGCMQNPFDDTMKLNAAFRGFGGVSLGACSEVAIQMNRIEANGPNASIPVCGICVVYGEGVDVSHNHIINNGSIQAGFDPAKLPVVGGIRGGVVMLATSLSALDLLSGADSSFVTGRPAARVHDNVVNQPFGSALTLLALGPLSLVGNQFNSELLREGYAVKLADLGLPVRLSASQSAAGGLGELYLRPAKTGFRFPGGTTIFADNQTRVGPASKGGLAGLLISLDDIAFSSNQSCYLGSAMGAANTAMFAVTLKASHSRFEEPADSRKKGLVYSLLTHGQVFNSTTDNQGDDCILALPVDPTKTVDRDNQELNPACLKLRGVFVAKKTEHPGGAEEAVKFAQGLPTLARSERAEGLKRLAHVYASMRVMLDHEESRLASEYSAEEPRLVRVRASLKQNLDAVKGLVAETDVVEIEVPKVGGGEVLIHGLVTDENGLGVEGIAVRITNPRRKTIAGLPEGKTDSQGYYTIVISADALTRIGKVAAEGVILAIGTAEHPSLKRTSEPMVLAAGDQRLVEVALSDEELRLRPSKPERIRRIEP